MAPHLSLILKLAAMVCLLLPLVMALLHWRWPDISWGFHFLFGLQVMLLLAAVQLVVSSIWPPGSRWNLPGRSSDPQRRIFVKKGSPVARLRALFERAKELVQAGLGRLRLRKAP